VLVLVRRSARCPCCMTTWCSQRGYKYSSWEPCHELSSSYTSVSTSQRRNRTGMVALFTALLDQFRPASQGRNRTSDPKCVLRILLWNTNHYAYEKDHGEWMNCLLAQFRAWLCSPLQVDILPVVRASTVLWIVPFPDKISWSPCSSRWAAKTHCSGGKFE
jgi:hypothetical protein